MNDFTAATVRGQGQSTGIVVHTVTGYENVLYGRVLCSSGIEKRRAVAGVQLVDVSPTLGGEQDTNIIIIHVYTCILHGKVCEKQSYYSFCIILAMKVTAVCDFLLAKSEL